MGSVSEGKRRPSEAIPTELRWNLLGCYRADRAYIAAVAQDLRPLWGSAARAVERATPPRLAAARGNVQLWPYDDVANLYEEQAWAEEDGGNPRDPDLAAYVGALRRFVWERMGLQRDGEPPPWALIAVHSDVAGFRWLPDFGLALLPEEATIALRVTSDYARIAVRDGMGEPMVDPVEIDAGDRMSFDRWGDLRKAGVAQLDAAIERLIRNPVESFG